MSTKMKTPFLLVAAVCALLPRRTAGAAPGDDDDAAARNPCQLYIAESTIPHAGLGVFAGVPFRQDALVGRAGDAAFPTVDHDWHNSPAGAFQSKHDLDYHWPLTNYDWNAPDVGMAGEAADVSVTVTGFGAAPNCHFRLLNVLEHAADYDAMGLDRYASPGAGASTPWHNRTSTAARDIDAGSELFVDYGPVWFTSRDGIFELVPVPQSFEKAQAFLTEYGKLLVGTNNPRDLVEDKMALDDDAQRDLWDIIKTFPYASREREALPDDHRDGVRAIHGDIQVIEKENSIRPVRDLEDRGKCIDNIAPGMSALPHAGRGAFATRAIPQGGLVAPAPVVHIADRAAADMYEEGLEKGRIVRDEGAGVVGRQIIVNYMFSHPNSTVLLFPYSSNVAYINHHATEYNAEVRWATDAPWIHHEEWLEKPVSFLEGQWSSGLMLEFIALRDIQPGEEVLINYGEEWQNAWDEHVKNWKPIPVESDYNNITMWTKPSKTNSKAGYVRAEVMNGDTESPLRTTEEQLEDPYPHSVQIMCRVNVNHATAYLFAPETAPSFTRDWGLADLAEYEDLDAHKHQCNVTARYKTVDDDDDAEEDHAGDDVEEDSSGYDAADEVRGRHHKYVYTVEVAVEKRLGDSEAVIRERHEIEDVPLAGIYFADKYYTSDVFLKNSFRHEMKLEVFPRAWMKEGEK